MDEIAQYTTMGKQWIDQIPGDWSLFRLKNLGSLKISTVDRIESANEHSVSICHYPQAYHNEIINNATKLSSGTCSSKEKENFGLLKGQILLTKDSETAEDIGVASYVEEDINNAVCGYHIAMFEVNSSAVLPKYLFRFLQSTITRNYFSINSNGVTRFGLGKGVIENTYIAIPNLLEQKKIVDYLDTKTSLIERLVSQKKDLIRLLKLKRQSIVSEAITKGVSPNAKMVDSKVAWIGLMPANWKLVRIKNIFKIKKEIANELGYDILSVTQKGIKIKDISNNKGQLSMDYRKYQIVEKGEFIMNHMDLLTGYVDISAFHGVTSPDYRVFKATNEQVYARFYLYIFQLCYTNRIFFGLGQGVAQQGRWRMPARQFNDFLVPMPDRSEQLEIVEYLRRYTSNIDIALGQQSVAIEKLEEYKKALVNEVVSGKLKF